MFPYDENAYFIEFKRLPGSVGEYKGNVIFRWFKGVGREGKQRAISEGRMIIQQGNSYVRVIETDGDGIVLRSMRVK
jgi:hypothetical protein